jgi:hypothetical protein
MTIPRIESVGFCAHYSRQGDWAFDYALRLAEQNSWQLNVFHFLSDPYDPADDTEERFSRQELTQLAIDKEREMRLYYDELAGEYLKIGFRLCFDNSWRELHRCLAGQEFQLLVLGQPAAAATFCGKPIKKFADGFICPVILVGPDQPDQFSLNSRAAIQIDNLGIPTGSWNQIEVDLGSNAQLHSVAKTTGSAR